MIKNIIPTMTCMLILSITGCMQRQDMNTIITKQSRIEHLRQMQNWHAQGRVSIKNATQSKTASFQWQQNGPQYEVYLYSPFSAESVTIIGNATSRRILAANSVSDPELDLDENLPFAQLGCWAKGLPTPNSTPELVKYDSFNQLQSLQQDGWRIDYHKYQSCTQVSLPERLTLTDGETTVKLFIKH